MLSEWKQSHTLLTLVSAATVIVGTTAIIIWYKRKKSRISLASMTFVEVGKLEKLIIYPVKSLGGVEVQSAVCTKLGLKVGAFKDRSWLVVQGNGHFITQRQEPTLAVVRTSFHDNELWIDGPNMDTLKVVNRERVGKNDKVMKCRIWGVDIMAVDCGNEAATWLQKYLNKPGIRLVQFCAPTKPRPANIAGATFDLNAENYPTIFTDENSYHLINQMSVNDLNQRISEGKEKVTYRNFRPNFLVSGEIAYDEDNWRYVQIGDDATFLQIKPCTRCQLTTINPDMGKKDDNEPIDTLKTFRISENEKQKPHFGTSPMFGTFMGLEIGGEVRVGDPVLAVLSN